MQIDDAKQLGYRLIQTGLKHADYNRTVALAEDYRIFITGQNIEKKLIRIVQREELEAFAQRVRLTKSITPAISSSLRQAYNKVARNDRVKKDIHIDDKGKKQIVEEMMKKFYGSSDKKNRGLDYWLKTRLCDLEFIDPNAWVVVEWDAVGPSQPISPRPFEVPAHEAINFKIVNEQVKWLFIQQPIDVLKYKKPEDKNLPDLVTPPPSVINIYSDTEVSSIAAAINGFVPYAPPVWLSNVTTKSGFKYTLYDEDYTVVFEQIDTAYLDVSGYIIQPNEQTLKIGKHDYLVKVYQPKLGYVPAFRIGYKKDEATNARTFVNPWHDALCYFEKSLKTVSEFDLTMNLHTFPRLLQYVQQCEGEKTTTGRNKPCNGGYLPDGSTCRVCKGTGMKVHASSQDVTQVPLPNNATQADLLDLSKLMVYVSPPLELVKFQNEYVQQLERQAHQAVFNSQVFVKTATNADATGNPIQTATEVDYNMQAVYDALEPFTEKISELWIDFVVTFAILAGIKQDNVEVSHDFPADFKLKTDGVLLTERQMATASGAPGYLVETLDDDLAAIMFAGDDVGLNAYRTKRRYFPFVGNTPEEIAFLAGDSQVLDEAKVLYKNFEMIFRDIVRKRADFYEMEDMSAQKKLVDDMVAEYKVKLDEQNPDPVLPSFSSSIGTAGNGDTGSNPGAQPPQKVSGAASTTERAVATGNAATIGAEQNVAVN